MCAALLTSTILSAGAPAAFAQYDGDNAQEVRDVITVTSRKRAENLQEVPIAITVLSQELIEDGQFDELDEFVELVPNTTFTTDAETSAEISIRGSGRTIGDEDPSVGLFRDGVYIGGLLFSTATFYDVERVEVLRGPQAGLYGRNAVGGALNVTSRKPDLADFSGYGQVRIGSKDRQELRAAINIPLIDDKWAIRVAGLHVDQDKGFDYIVNHDQYVDAQLDRSLRVRSLYTPNDEWEFLTTFEVIESNGGNALSVAAPEAETGYLDDLQAVPLPAVSADETDQQFRTTPSVREFDQIQAVQEINWRTDYGTVTVLASYRSADFLSNRDEDYSEFEVSQIDYDASQDSWFVEARFASEDYNGFRFLAGINYLNEDIALNFENLLGGLFYGAVGGADIANLYATGAVTPDWAPIFGAPVGLPISFIGLTPFATGWTGYLGDSFPTEYINEQSVSSVAPFVELYYTVNDSIDIWANVRYTRDKKNINFAQTFGIPSQCPVACPEIFALFFDGLDPEIIDQSNATYTNVSPGGGVNVRITDNFNAYAKVVTGFKAGGFNSVASTVDFLPFEEEKTISYEAGFKSDLFDNKLRFNAAGFFQKRKNALVTVIDPFLPINSLGVNAGEIENKGAEVEISAKPTSRLRFDIATGYLDAEFTDFVFGGFDFTGNQVPRTFKFTLSAIGSYTEPLTDDLDAFFYAYYRNGWDGFTNLDNIEKMSNPEVVDMRLGVKADQWRVVLYGDNVFDNRYTATEFRSVFDNSKHFGTFAPGRTYGVQLSYEF